MNAFYTCVQSCIHSHDITFFLTSTGGGGGIGACFCGGGGDLEDRDGDVLALLSGLDFPVVLRKTEIGEEYYRFVEVVFLEEVMDGEVWLRKGELWDITLI